ncbi:MAG: DUF6782 family putative metallopeptidase [Alphaproteobacteria bacterium]
MTPVQEQSESSLGAFNRASKGFGDWLYQKRHGKHDVRRAEMLTRIATFPGGTGLLNKAGEMGCDILVKPEKEVGAQGAFDDAGDQPVITIANTGNPAGMAIALWHELRHMAQYAANPGKGVAGPGQLKDARTAHMMGVMIEADAFTAETLMALQQKKAGNSEYYDAMFAGTREPGAHRDILRFLRAQPYESFNDDAKFARALFTHLMMDGLLSYRTRYFSYLGAQFAAADNVDSFRARVAASKRGGMKAGPELGAFYGPGYTAVSPRALATAFLPVQPVDEQQMLALVERTVKRAPHLTENEFQQAKKEIFARKQDIWQKDPDDYDFPTPAQEKMRRVLQDMAKKDKPQPFPVIWD